MEKSTQNPEKIENNNEIENNYNYEEENKKIDIIKDILSKNFVEKEKKFKYVKNNEFIFDEKYNVVVELNGDNEIIIEIENNKYNIEEFMSKYCKEVNKNEVNENKNEKEKFIYKKKIGKIQNAQNKINNETKQENTNEIENEHQKKRRKKRIYDEDSEKEKNEAEKLQ